MYGRDRVQVRLDLHLHIGEQTPSDIGAEKKCQNYLRWFLGSVVAKTHFSYDLWIKIVTLEKFLSRLKVYKFSYVTYYITNVSPKLKK